MRGVEHAEVPLYTPAEILAICHSSPGSRKGRCSLPVKGRWPPGRRGGDREREACVAGMLTGREQRWSRQGTARGAREAGTQGGPGQAGSQRWGHGLRNVAGSGRGRATLQDPRRAVFTAVCRFQDGPFRRGEDPSSASTLPPSTSLASQTGLWARARRSGPVPAT